MNRDEYGLLFHRMHLNLVAFKPLIECDKEVIALVNKAIKQEREACARVCDEQAQSDMLGQAEKYRAWFIADTIRARGEVETKTPDYLEKCPNCGGPADNGFDRSWPDPNPYYCTKCMETGEY